MAGETETVDTDFAERERQAAEDRAFELNPYGTGVDPDLHLGYDYDYEESPDLMDADYQPNNSFSDDFTNYGGADPYSSQFGQDDKDETDEDENDNSESQRYRAEDYGDEIEDWDGDDEDDGGENGDKENDDSAADDAENDQLDGGVDDETTEPSTKRRKNETPQQQAKREVKAQKQAAKAAQRAEFQNLKINWRPGDRIDLKMLSSVWGQCRKINKVRPLMDTANQALEGALIASGPNLMIKLNKYVESVQEQSNDLIGSLLKLTSSDGKRLAFTTAAIVEAIFDQQWLQPVMLATLPTTLEGLIAAQPLQGILNSIFTIAVPIINGTAKKQSKGK